MDKLFSLDSRLMTCASFVPNGARLADIGTDHAYLPVWLIKNNIVSYAIASDINDGPLLAGRKTAEKYYAENIDFRLGCGLETITDDDNINTIVIAGMGGELIAHILEDCKLTINKKIRFILQPMTKAHKLVDFLYKNGFEITKQKTCTSHNKHYTVMMVTYCGNNTDIDEVFSYIGILNPENNSDKLYLLSQIRNLEKQGKGNPHYSLLAEKIKEILK